MSKETETKTEQKPLKVLTSVPAITTNGGLATFSDGNVDIQAFQILAEDKDGVNVNIVSNLRFNEVQLKAYSSLINSVLEKLDKEKPAQKK